jgi:hypothetical protein
MSFRRILRYAVAAIAIAALLIGIKACSTPGEQAVAPSSSPSVTVSDATSSVSGKPKININSAILSELDKLEAQLGVPALSHKIQASRPYGSTEDLVSKKVISQAQFDQIKEQITIEEIALTGEAKDIDYMTKLGLMKGHMIVAGELLDLKKPDQAEPHIGHPVEEIYVDLEEQFPERKVPDFKDVLTQVQDLVKSKPDDPQVKPKFQEAMTAIDTAIAALPETQRQAPKFVFPVINGMLETAVAEYTAGIADGQIKAIIEYQDSRGFVEYAEGTLFKAVAPQIDAKASQDMAAMFTELKKAWPAAIAPTNPVFTPDQVAAKVKQIEMTSAPIVQASAS